MKTSFASISLSVISHLNFFFFFFWSCIQLGRNCHLLQSEVNVWWLFQCGELFDKNKLRAAAVPSTEKSPWFSCSHTQLDVFRFTQTRWLWHGRWRWNRPPSVHKYSITLPALCAACRDDTRGSGLYWVLLRVLCYGRHQALVKLRLRGSSNKTWPVERRPLGGCWRSL